MKTTLSSCEISSIAILKINYFCTVLSKGVHIEVGSGYINLRTYVAENKTNA